MKTRLGLMGLLLFFSLALAEKRLDSPNLPTSYLLLGLSLISVTLIAYLFGDSLYEVGKDSKKLMKFLGTIFLLFLLKWMYLKWFP